MDVKSRIDICMKRTLCDKVFKNAKVVNVFNRSIEETNICVQGDEIIALGDYEGKETIDCEGRVVIPALVDGHVHIESSMVTPNRFAEALIADGVLTAICDPHEIANVMGKDGISFMLESSEKIGMDCFFMLPSCVPCTSFEHAGATLTAEDLKEFQHHPRVLGLGEMMNYVGLVNNDEEVLKKLSLFSDQIIDGHSPSLTGDALRAYRAAGVATDHECSTKEELDERIALGMYVQIRQGSAAKNADRLLDAVNTNNMDRVFFCTDDKHPEDLEEKGNVDEICRMALKKGFSIVDVARMASTNACTCYGLKKRGAVSAGYLANFIVLDDVENFKIHAVYKEGKLVAENGKVIFPVPELKTVPGNGVHLSDYTPDDLKLPLENPRCHVMEIIPNELVTKHVVEEVTIKDGYFQADETYQKLLVIERHHGIHSIGKAIIKGFGLQHGAMCSTIAHDSHNIVVLGDNDKDMYLGIQRIQEIGGGFVLVQNGEILKEFPLEIGGIMSAKKLPEVRRNVAECIRLAHEKLSIHSSIDPIITLGFMSLPVIPEIKLTDKGLFDVAKFQFIEVQA